MHLLNFIASGLLTIPIVHAIPAINPSSAASAFVSSVCTAPGTHFNPLELDVASIFCSAFLHVKTATVTLTSTSVLPAQTSSAIHQTVIVTDTATNYATVTVSSTTSTTLPALTSVSTAFITPAPVTDIISTTVTLPESIVQDTLPASLVTITTVNTIVIGSTVTTYTTRTQTAETFIKRQAAPSGFLSFAANVVSSACSCLVHTPTSTIHATVTSTPATLAAPIISTTLISSVTVVSSATVDLVFTNTIPASTVVVETQTTLPASLVSITQTATAPVITSTQTITPSPVTVTSSSTTYTTSVATATTVRVATIDYEFHLVNGPNNGCFYDAGLKSGFIKEQDDGSCATNCANTPGCITFTTALYVPGGGTACYLFSGAYQSQYLDCKDYSDYSGEVVYSLVGTTETVA